MGIYQRVLQLIKQPVSRVGIAIPSKYRVQQVPPGGLISLSTQSSIQAACRRVGGAALNQARFPQSSGRDGRD